MEGGGVHTQTLRLVSLLLGALTLASLMAVLVSMAGEDITVEIPGPTGIPIQLNFSTQACWNWREEAESAHQDCSLDFVFTSVILSAVVVLVLISSAVPFHFKRSGGIDLDCGVNVLTQSSVWRFLEYNLPLFCLVVTSILLIVFVALVFEDGRDSVSPPDWLNLRELMVHRKPWRIGLTIASLILSILACIPAGRLAIRWRENDSSGYSHLQARSSRRGRRARSMRPTLKSALIFDNAEL